MADLIFNKRYISIKEIGSGAFGVVYSVCDPLDSGNLKNK
jgi:hypothetical protein